MYVMVSVMPRTETFPLQVRIPPELHKRLLARSAAEARQIKTIVIRAIERELDEAECEKRHAKKKSR